MKIDTDDLMPMPLLSKVKRIRHETSISEVNRLLSEGWRVLMILGGSNPPLYILAACSDALAKAKS